MALKEIEIKGHKYQTNRLTPADRQDLLEWVRLESFDVARAQADRLPQAQALEVLKAAALHVCTLFLERLEGEDLIFCPEVKAILSTPRGLGMIGWLLVRGQEPKVTYEDVLASYQEESA